mgnify:CR=1 FL=1
MKGYDWLNYEINQTFPGSNIGFTQLVATEPQMENVKANSRLKIIHTFQEKCIEIFKNALTKQDELLLFWLINETPDSLGLDYHRSLSESCFKRPVFFRTDEMDFGKIAEIQCPGSHWGELELLYNYYKESFSVGQEPAKNFVEQLKCYLGKSSPTVLYLTDNSSAPAGVRYFIEKTRPQIRYWGIDSMIDSKSCDFIRTHSFFGLCSENYHKLRLEFVGDSLEYDYPPNVLFDQKATLVLPFWSKTRDLFSDDIRDLIIYSTPLISNNIELDNGDILSIEEFSRKPQSQRRYYLKYAGSDVTKNWGSRGVYRLSNESSTGCEILLKKCLKALKDREIWMLQKEISNKKRVEYYDIDGKKKSEQRNVKYSSFYGPLGLIGILGYYRKHFKVHGQNDTVLSYIISD